MIVMERMRGIPISQIDTLMAEGVDMKKLSRDGVVIFFTQVFRDGFFHADMHPGNILVSTRAGNLGRYIALDFGIVGTLTDFDKDYLAQNFLAFFQPRLQARRRGCTSNRAGCPRTPASTSWSRAVRAVCEPNFDRPLKDISFGQVLLRLFQTSRRFNVQIQPQLVLLQKTLLNIEGLGRELDPDLDLWTTAKPYLERWMHRQVGWRGLVERLKHEVPHYVEVAAAIAAPGASSVDARDRPAVARAKRLDEASARRAKAHQCAAGDIAGHRRLLAGRLRGGAVFAELAFSFILIWTQAVRYFW